MQKLSTEERFWSKVNKTEDCWEWVGTIAANGYGRLKVDYKHKSAHRLAYEFANGPIAEGMEIDHLCHNKACVKPGHLRAATRKQNGENRQGAAASNKHSGVRGVVKERGRWAARVKHNGVPHIFGYFYTIEEAAEAAAKGRASLFTPLETDNVA